MKIYALVKDFNGSRCNVRFVNGVGETNDPQAIAWFRSHGYKVPIEETPKVEQPTDEMTLEKVLEEVEESNPLDFESMTPNDLRDWMRENGYGSKIKNTRNKEKLLEILRG